MKLFVWVNPYSIDYGMSILTVMANSLEEAKELAKTGKNYAFGEYEDPIPEIELGPPTRVIEGPCAEWNWWSE